MVIMTRIRIVIVIMVIWEEDTDNRRGGVGVSPRHVTVCGVICVTGGRGRVNGNVRMTE